MTYSRVVPGRAALSRSCMQFCGDDGTAESWQGVAQFYGAACGLLCSLALHADFQRSERLCGEVVHIESAREICIRRHSLRVGGILCVGGALQQWRGFVVDQCRNEQRAAVGVFFPRRFTLVDQTGLRHGGLCINHERVGGVGATYGFIDLHAEVDAFVANGQGIIKEHIVPSGVEVGVDRSDVIVGRA